jgi:hypothetical protein
MLVSVPALYDGEQVRLLEKAPVHGPYRVLVTFIEPAGEPARPSRDLASFWRSFGAWQDERPVEETLRDIKKARRSKAEPPVRGSVLRGPPTLNPQAGDTLEVCHILRH